MKRERGFRVRTMTWVGARAAVAWVLLLTLAACQAADDGDGSGDGDMDPPGTGGDGGDGGGSGDGGTGMITLDEYDWFNTEPFLGVIQVDLATGTKRRFLEGRHPSRHPSGTTSFLQGCGARVSRVALADPQGLIRVATPCSSEIPNVGYSPTDFGFSKLSPDQSLVAVEAIYYLENGFAASTIVFEVEGPIVALFDYYYAPTWTPDGRLVVVGDGLYMADPGLSALERIDGGQLNGFLNNPNVHPSGERMVFQYNQQIWEMNTDGSGLREVVSAGRDLWFPSYSPDGDAIVYLASPVDDQFERALYFTDLATGEPSALDLNDQLPGDLSVVPNGPLSWTAAEGR